MSAFNVVRFRVKPGQEDGFIDAHRKMHPKFKGFQGGHLVRTGDSTFCFVGQWRNFDQIAEARPEMIAFLDSLRDMLEDLGGDLGVTDPVSGESVVSYKPSKAKHKGGKHKNDKKAKKGKGKGSKKGKRKSRKKSGKRKK
jgi:quinol monooxygenase YgiN